MCLPQSVEYFRTYFAGSLGFVMYNIFVGILQSVGDSRHPLIYLILSSCINVVLDLLLHRRASAWVSEQRHLQRSFPSSQARFSA